MREMYSSSRNLGTGVHGHLSFTRATGSNSAFGHQQNKGEVIGGYH